MKTSITTFILTVATLHAHPGHTDQPHSHDGWPFPDVKWSITIVAISLIAFAIYKLRKKA